MLGEIALGDVHLAAAANATPAADRIEIDAERARGFQETHAFCELAAFSGRRKDDAMGQEINWFEAFRALVSSSCHARKSGHPEEAATSFAAA
jgi:hypothetical protein